MNTQYTYWDRIKKGVFKTTLFMFCIFILVAIPRLNVWGILTFAITATLLIWLPIIALQSLIDYAFLRKTFRKYGKVDYNLHQFREVIIKIDKELAYKSALEALKQLKGVKNIKSNINQGMVEAQTKVYCKSMGENIKIKISEEPSGRIVFNIYSSPIKKMAIGDLAQNYENVEKVSAYLKKDN